MYQKEDLFYEIDKKFFEEEQRLLYVALTRAIEYLFVYGCAKQSSLSAKFSPTPMSFMEWFAPLLLSKDRENSEIFDIEYYDVSNLESWEKGNQEHPVLISKQDDGIVSELNKRLDFTYAHEKQTITPQKTTISASVFAACLLKYKESPT